MALARLGPFGPAPHLAVAVSGGADSTALALLTQNWVTANQGRMLALIVDHGLRPDSAAEAELTRNRLAARGIASQILTLAVPPGPALQARARDARYAALTQASREAGCLHLLLGHHAADQAETVAMRAARGTGGLEGMAAWTARNDFLVLLRPLLGFDPADLRAYLRAENMAWVEDPSNTNLNFERVRIRQAGAGQNPADPAPRQQAEHAAAGYLAANVTIQPAGFAVIHTENLPSLALAILLRIIGGADYAPAQPAVAELARRLRPATLGGVRIAAAGRYGPGWLLTREVSACAPPVAAIKDTRWDGRFKLLEGFEGAECGALGKDARNYRKSSDLPAAVLQTMPCLRLPDGSKIFPVNAVFSPPAPAAGHPFLT